MRMLRELTFVAALVLVARGSVSAQREEAVPTAADAGTYAALLARMLEGDTTADFTTFRLLAAKLHPSLEHGPTPAEQFARALAAPDSLSARAHVYSVLQVYGGHIQAHIDAAHLYQQRGDRARARRENAIVRAFIASIGANGGAHARDCDEGQSTRLVTRGARSVCSRLPAGESTVAQASIVVGGPASIVDFCIIWQYTFAYGQGRLRGLWCRV